MGSNDNEIDRRDFVKTSTAAGLGLLCRRDRTGSPVRDAWIARRESARRRRRRERPRRRPRAELLESAELGSRVHLRRRRERHCQSGDRTRSQAAAPKVDRRLPPRARRQVCRRDLDRRAGSLARAHDATRDEGGQARLPREAERPRSARGRAAHCRIGEVQDARAARNAAALRPALLRGDPGDQGRRDRHAVSRARLVRQHAHEHRQGESRARSVESRLRALAGTGAAHAVSRQRRSLQLALVHALGHRRDLQQRHARNRRRASGCSAWTIPTTVYSTGKRHHYRRRLGIPRHAGSDVRVRRRQNDRLARSELQRSADVRPPARHHDPRHRRQHHDRPRRLCRSRI